MKAAVYYKYGKPEVLQVVDIKKPTPKDNELLIKIFAAAVNSTDPIDRKGEPFMARVATGFLKPKKPILGDTLSGEVEAVGKDVKKFKKGDKVYGATGLSMAAHAEYKCMSEEEALVIKPSVISHEEAAGIVDGALTALTFLRDKGNIQKGQKVLIYGASGSIGTSAVQLAKYFGTEVTGVCSTGNVKLVKSLGADKVIDYKKEDFTKTGNTWDIIFDTVGKSSFGKCKSALSPSGVYLTTVPTPSLLIHLLTSRFCSKKAKFAAAGIRPAKEKIEGLEFLNKLFKAKKLKSVIDKTYLLDEIVEAHRYVEAGHKKGNVVITMKHKKNK